MMNNILITGANGLLGRILAEHLNKSGYNGKIFGIDCSDEGAPSKRFILDNAVDSLLLSQAFCGEYYKVDVTELDELKKVFKKIGTIDIVIHLATAAETETPELIKYVNELGTENIFQFCREKKIRKIILASSMMTVAGKLIDTKPYCYINKGNYQKLPSTFEKIHSSCVAIPTDINPSVLAYIESKLKAERLASSYVNKGISTICLRFGAISSTDVPYDPPGLRSIWCSHRDACNFVKLAMEKLCLELKTYYRVYFVCSNNNYRWLDLDDSKYELGFMPKDNADDILKGQANPATTNFTVF